MYRVELEIKAYRKNASKENLLDKKINGNFKFNSFMHPKYENFKLFGLGYNPQELLSLITKSGYSILDSKIKIVEQDRDEKLSQLEEEVIGLIENGE